MTQLNTADIEKAEAPSNHFAAKPLIKASKENPYGIHADMGYVVRTPDPTFNGPRCGVNFVNGEATLVAIAEDVSDEQRMDRNRRVRNLADAGYDVFLLGNEPKRAVVVSPSGEGEFDQLSDGSDN